jgi:methylmalonyl-CoA mutase N-terminal domain/subunit
MRAGVLHGIEEDIEPEILKVDEDVQQRQRERLAELAADRDDEAVEEAFGAVADAAEAEENVVPAVIEAVKAYATMGEIMSVFKQQYGAYRETVHVA